MFYFRKEMTMRSPCLVPMLLGETHVGMIHKFVSPKEVIESVKEFSEKKRREMEKKGKKESKPVKLKRTRK